MMKMYDKIIFPFSVSTKLLLGFLRSFIYWFLMFWFNYIYESILGQYYVMNELYNENVGSVHYWSHDGSGSSNKRLECWVRFGGISEFFSLWLNLFRALFAWPQSKILFLLVKCLPGMPVTGEAKEGGWRGNWKHHFE